MSMKTIDAGMVQKCFLSGAKRIEANKEYINELNVFPVPDGDTGTNMTLTIMSAAKDVAGLENPSMEQVCKAISGGSLRGARGNSGVILSQLFRGFTKELKEQKDADVTVLAAAFERAVETAYKAVMKPKEGTILTVARGGAKNLSVQLGGVIGEVGEEAVRIFAEQKAGFSRSFDISANLATRKLEKHLTILKPDGDRGHERGTECNREPCQRRNPQRRFLSFRTGGDSYHRYLYGRSEHDQ